MGTVITDNQCRLLSRLRREWPDGDNAGRKAANAGVGLY